MDNQYITCEFCAHCKDIYVSGYDGRGILEAGKCEFDFFHPKVVDKTALRICASRREK